MALINYKDIEEVKEDLEKKNYRQMIYTRLSCLDDASLKLEFENLIVKNKILNLQYDKLEEYGNRVNFICRPFSSNYQRLKRMARDNAEARGKAAADNCMIWYLMRERKLEF